MLDRKVARSECFGCSSLSTEITSAIIVVSKSMILHLSKCLSPFFARYLSCRCKKSALPALGVSVMRAQCFQEDLTGNGGK